MRAILVLTYVFLLFLSCNSSEPNSYASFGSKFSSNEESEIAFSNTGFVDSILNNKQIILLGELDHGDGSSFEVKSSLIRYLHEELGFNTLIFETSLINCHYFMNSLDSIQDIQKLARETIYHIWSEVEETQDMFKFIQSQNQSANPLKVVGIDPQFSGRSGNSLFINKLKTILPETLVNSSDFKTFQAELNLISKWLVFPQLDDHKISEQEFLQITNLIESLVIQKVEKQEIPLWNQFFENIKVLARIKWFKDKDGAFEVRDKQMFQNLDRYLKDFPNEKIIVWAANGHIIRNDNKLKGDDIIWKGIKKLGDHINQDYKSKTYSIGITSYDGKTADWYYKKNKYRKINRPSRNSLEYKLKGIDSVLIDLRLFESTQNLSSYESQLLYTNIRNSSTWSDNFDGTIFLKTMKPSRKIELDK